MTLDDAKAVAVTVAGETREFPSAIAAIGALLRDLPTEQLGSIFWQNLVRRVQQERTDGLPGPHWAVGSKAVSKA